MTIDDISYLDPESINGLNLYAYCVNNPVMGYDPNGTWDWGTFLGFLGSSISIGLGVLLCFIPGAQLIGAGLIVSGALSMSVNIMNVCGVDSKTVAIIESISSIAIGTISMFIPGMQVFGATMLGSGIGGLAGGYISEYYGGDFAFGSAIGGFLGGLIGGGIYKGLQRMGVVGTYVKLNDIKFNPEDDLVTKGPYDKAVSHWTRVLGQNPNAYNSTPGLDGKIEKIQVIIDSENTLANGHHRVYVMLNKINNAPKYIKVFLTK
jgi:hypothetical protein